ncbi:MAG: UDP-N-acetylmuramoyl-L-alanine--D-glutamate ligase [Parcubacteria group bacterium]|nr:UDP-N-acetylmuramoyl-L-alanine--D-glutamate ligase [Parcubacteria group bacterium]
MNLSHFENKNIHIVGVSGAEGSAVAEFLTDNLEKAKITAHDFCQEKDFKESFNSFHDAYTEPEKAKLYEKLSNLPVKFHFKAEYLKDIEQADLIFVPQSWFRYQENKKLLALADKPPFYNITKLYFALCPCPIVAVTGTSGKSTTTRLIYEILSQGGSKVWLTGNDRQNIQVLSEIAEMTSKDIMVMEVSNRQLKIDLGKSPQVAVITNVSPSHLDDHKDYADYIATKQSILKYQSDQDFAVLNHDNEVTRQFTTKSKANSYLFSQREELTKGCYVEQGNIYINDGNSEHKICSTNDIMLPGPHNVSNILAAAMATFLLGASTKHIREITTSYQGLPSRLEFVREINKVKYYEDSSSCNPDGTRAAIKSFKNPLILIAGGSRQAKMPDEYQQLAEDVAKSKIKVLLLIGEEGSSIEEAIRQEFAKQGISRMLIKQCADLAEAVNNAYTASDPGDVVVLSPGCESFGMFRDYRDRGYQFKELVTRIA